MTIRRPAVAGTFYLGDAAALAADVDRMLEATGPRPGPAPAVALLPHAGHVYSGPVAAAGYRRLADSGRDAKQVVILCPNHTVPLQTMAVTAADEWATPLGEVSVDDDIRKAVAALPGVVVDETPHRTEHAVEVHLPFLQRITEPGWTVTPIVVGEVDDQVGGALVDTVLATGALLIVSTDLSHYLPHTEARHRDDATIAAILGHDAGAIGRWDACGRNAVCALLASSGIESLQPELLDARTSADTAGHPDRTVGYASIVWSR
jgi:AmmeMemoRadiSam system protein B